MVEFNVVIVVGFNEESEKAVKVFMELSRELLKYDIYLYVRVEQFWKHDPVTISSLRLPHVYVDGKLSFIGSIPSKKELLRMFLQRALFKSRK